MKTAVEWAINEIRNNWYDYEYGDADMDDLIKKAKEMEKEKLEQFYNHGQWAVIENGHGECFEDYYNRTFKSE